MPKKVLVILSIRQIQIKITFGFHLPLVKVAKSERTTAGGFYDWGSRLESPQTKFMSDTAVSPMSCSQQPGNGKHLMSFT